MSPRLFSLFSSVFLGNKNFYKKIQTVFNTFVILEKGKGSHIKSDDDIQKFMNKLKNHLFEIMGNMIDADKKYFFQKIN